MFNLCRPIMPSGAKCHTPALRGKPYCYYHTRLHRFPAAKASPSMASRSPRKTSSATHSSSPITTVESITHTDTGEELAPPERICDTPEDCATCAERDTCQDSEIHEEEEEAQSTLRTIPTIHGSAPTAHCTLCIRHYPLITDH